MSADSLRSSAGLWGRLRATSSRAPITVAQVMLAPVITLLPAATVAEALDCMGQRGCDTLVIEPPRRSTQLGLLTLRDIQTRVLAAQRAPQSVTVGAVMSAAPLVVAPAMWVEDCATLLLAAQVRRAIVVQGGRPIGLIYDSDIFQAIESRRA